MNDFIQDDIRLFEYLSCKIEKIVQLYHMQREYEAAAAMKDIIQEFEKYTEQIYRGFARLDPNRENFSPLLWNNALTQVLDAQRNRDYILLADLLDILLKQGMYHTIQYLLQEQWEKRKLCYESNRKILEKTHGELLCQIESCNPRENVNYFLEPCNNGAVTLRLEEDGCTYYLCSNISPQKAAWELAAFYCQNNVKQYYLWGFGLGYEAEAILEVVPYAKLCVIELDSYIIKVALEQRDLTELFSNPRFSLKLQADKGLLENLQQTKGRLLVHAPSIRHIQDMELKESLENYYINFTSIKEHSGMLHENFNSNMELELPNIVEMREIFKNHQMIYIGGGPSLDKTIDLIRKLEKNYEVVCAGTVVKKLRDKGIFPDYVIISDPLPSIINQIKENVDRNRTSLLFISTASKDAVKSFDGNRYIILQKGFEPAEMEAAEKNIMLFETGGSVSTVALDVGLRFGCSKILCFGLDLAYTNNITHASNTVDFRNIKLEEYTREVDCITGGTVKTARNLDIYKRWIEKRLRCEHLTEVINISDGAFIEGMENLSCNKFENGKFDEKISF